jgi:hypothetical protein
MSASDVYKTVTGAGVKCAPMAWQEGSAPELPWAVYVLDEDAPVMADGERYAECHRWDVELYQRERDAVLESALCAAIADRFGPYTLSEQWVSSENCSMLTITFNDYDEGSHNG